MYVLCTNHIMFQPKGKGLFIRSSKLFDSTPPIKPDNKALGCGFFFSSRGGRQIGERKQECMLLWIFLRLEVVTWVASSILYFTEWEIQPRREKDNTVGHGRPGKPWWTRGFPGGSADKESTCNAGDLGSIPGLGRSPGGGNGNPLQYSCLGNPMDRGAWRATVLGSQRLGHS